MRHFYFALVTIVVVLLWSAFLLRQPFKNAFIGEDNAKLVGAVSVSQQQLSQWPMCAGVIPLIYNAPEHGFSEDDLLWCKTKQAAYRIIVGKSYGQAPKHMQREWENKLCNDLVTNNGKLRSCSEKYGWGYIGNFLGSAVNILVTRLAPTTHGSGRMGSRVNCASDQKSSVVCGFHHVVVDFGKAPIVGIHRVFHRGFLTAFGEANPAVSLEPRIPGYSLADVEQSPFVCNSSSAGNCAIVVAAESTCDVYENRPTFIMSHDDIYNLAHHMNDVTMVWMMGILAGRMLNESLFITMDGIRSGGPSGKQGHRLVDKHRPDNLSPFNGYYSSWFNEVRQGVSYGTQKVCFKEIYFQPFPGLAWVWGDWTRHATCSLKTAAGVPAPSPLFQSFNWHVRVAWAERFGALPTPPAEPGTVHIVVMLRGETPQKQGGNIRVIANMAELVRALRGIGATTGLAVTVTEQDFGVLSFEEQVRLAHSASVFVGMHGAALPHIFNAAIGAPNCCSVVEIFPERAKGFSDIEGFGNIARLLGMNYQRYVVDDGHSSKVGGTTVSLSALLPLIKEAAMSASRRTICRHDVLPLGEPLQCNTTSHSKVLYKVL